ncbi:polysaccharide biosynthesis/export family protein [Aureimonas ureilytica]|uniref:polysaccharide biosynthesis/export family protein n=1 Tax=Aureimonas ureilytica TaxID=401562 RepID=UPI000378EBCB|nr:polysaccharide biosynthesis/export family protein [Aureimonas ureilytica]
MIRITSLLLASVLTLSGGLGTATGALAQPAPSGASSAPDGAGFTIGDKLRVTFFEQMDMPGGQGGAAPATTFYQRIDLTSDYVVGADGRISLPRLGAIKVAGRDADSVSADIQSAYLDAMGRPGDVHVAILERQPVYVLGPVRSPGAFAYASGMVAIQAIALAGGPERLQDRLAPVVEAGRETERSEDARTRLTLLLSRRAWLESVRDGTPPVVPDELVRLVGRTNAGEMVAADVAAGRAAASARESEIANFRQRARAWREEMTVLNRSLGEIEREITERGARIRQATEPDPRLSRASVITTQRTELVELERRRREVQASIHRIEQQLSETEAARARVSLEFDRTIAQELVTLTNDIVRLRQMASSASEIAGSLGDAASSSGSGEFDISIIRTAADGVETLAATPTTRLMPGDVVRVTRGGAVVGTSEAAVR